MCRRSPPSAGLPLPSPALANNIIINFFFSMARHWPRSCSTGHPPLGVRPYEMHPKPEAPPKTRGRLAECRRPMLRPVGATGPRRGTSSLPLGPGFKSAEWKAMTRQKSRCSRGCLMKNKSGGGAAGRCVAGHGQRAAPRHLCFPPPPGSRASSLLFSPQSRHQIIINVINKMRGQVIKCKICGVLLELTA